MGLHGLLQGKFTFLYVIIIYLTTLPVADVTNGSIISEGGNGKRVERSGRGLI
jgi:hypothetical protein